MARTDHGGSSAVGRVEGEALVGRDGIDYAILVLNHEELDGSERGSERVLDLVDFGDEPQLLTVPI